MSRRGVLATAAVAAATIALFFVSRGKWSDAIIDSGREWIVPDALARGELLYRDVVYWFGPFTPYFQAAFLRVFGSGFPSLVIAGAAAAAAALAVLHWTLRKVTGRAEAALWTALAIPVLVFMPNAGGILLGMGYRIWHAAVFALAAIAAGFDAGSDAKPGWRWPALWPPERGSAGPNGASSRSARRGCLLVGGGFSRERWKDCLVAAAVFLVVFGGILGVFIGAAGWTSVVTDCHVLLTGISPETRTFLVRFSGVQDWRAGIVDGLFVAASWIGAFLTICVIAARRSGTAGLRRFAIPLGLCLVVLLGAGLAGSWTTKPFSGAPCDCPGGAALCALAPRRRRRGGARRMRTRGIAAFLQEALPHRRLGLRRSAAAVCPRLRGRARGGRPSGRGRGGRFLGTARRMLRVAIGILICGAYAGRIVEYAAVESVPIAGTGGMLSARPELARRLERIAEVVRGQTGSDRRPGRLSRGRAAQRNDGATESAAVHAVPSGLPVGGK